MKYNWRFTLFIVLISACLLFFLGFFIYTRLFNREKYKTVENPTFTVNDISDLAKSTQQPIKIGRQFNKSEESIRKIVESLYRSPFPTVRPSFLKYVNGKNLELDMYNEDLKLAFEYNGVQHYKYSPFFHNSYQEYEEQVKRDLFKKEKCEEYGITLHIIPYTVKLEKAKAYIQSLMK